jgi:hypothetical protein
MESKQAFQGLEMICRPAWVLTGILAIAMTVSGSPVGAGDRAEVEHSQLGTYQEAGESTCASDSTWEAPPAPARLGQPF